MRVKFTQDYTENRGQKSGSGEEPRTFKKDEVVDFNAEFANEEPDTAVENVASWRRQRAAASARHFINRGVAEEADPKKERESASKSAKGTEPRVDARAERQTESKPESLVTGPANKGAGGKAEAL
ncbi:MAG TPA: hypothetical protein VM165_04445 [Planctomycetaceae bacterium]|nr:hypothetical protein [Planctomycetaceae bacterium]